MDIIRNKGSARASYRTHPCSSDALGEAAQPPYGVIALCAEADI
jgi:hypothetical protein